MESLPLFVDLDGTLITDDSLLEGVLGCVRTGPRAWIDLLQIRKGIPMFKQVMSAYMRPDLLVIREAVRERIIKAKQLGRTVVLATGAHQQAAQIIADRLGCFDGVIATDDEVNRVSRNKLQAIQAWTHGGPFAYIGNSAQDVAIWQEAAEAVVVGGWWQRWRFESRLPPERRGKGIPVHFPWSELWRALRPTQWVKNLLVLAPLIAGHVWVGTTWGRAVVGMMVFSLVCSMVYLVNDLLDVPHDRQHPKKSRRPIALGTVPVTLALKTVVVLLFTAAFGAWMLGSGMFAALLATYVLAAWSYSLFWKRLFALDLFVLAGLYSLRLYAGSFLADVPLSSWLIGVSFFVFMSLACMKRFASLQRTKEAMTAVEPGRAYREEDQPGLGVVGVQSAMAAVLMLCLYMQSEAAKRLYAKPTYLFAIAPIVLFLFVRAWLRTYRGEIQDDPIAAFVDDPVTYGAIFGAIVLASCAA